jgi:hypothetical protein
MRMRRRRRKREKLRRSWNRVSKNRWASMLVVGLRRDPSRVERSEESGGERKKKTRRANDEGEAGNRLSRREGDEKRVTAALGTIPNTLNSLWATGNRRGEDGKKEKLAKTTLSPLPTIGFDEESQSITLTLPSQPLCDNPFVQSHFPYPFLNSSTLFALSRLSRRFGLRQRRGERWRRLPRISWAKYLFGEEEGGREEEGHRRGKRRREGRAREEEAG